MSDLRSRITQVIADQIVNAGVLVRHGTSGDVQIVVEADAIADAVIAELGLQRDPFSGSTVERYVTKWTELQPYCQRCGSPHPGPCLRDA